MRLARKLMLAVALAVLTVMAAHGYLQRRQHVNLIDADLPKDLRVADTLRAALEAVWRTHGAAAAERLVEETGRGTDDVRIRWTWLDAAAGDAHRLDVPEALRAELGAGRILRWIPPADGQKGRRFTYVPLLVEGARPAVLEVAESMHRRHSFVAASTLGIAVTTALILACCALVVLGLGFSVERRTAESAARVATVEQLRHTDRLTTMGRLAARVAHELGTPINVIAGRARMIAADGGNPDATGANARIIGEQATRMTAIIRQMLDFSRRQEPRPVATNLRDLAARTVDMLAGFAQTTGVTLGLEPGDAPVPVDVDQSQMQQALTNVVLNAIQAMPDGGLVRVAVGIAETAPPPGRTGAGGPWAFVRVADAGHGVRSEDLPHIFEPFFTTRSAGTGAGLGLAVADGIVREHGGWIGVESEVGRGSRFTLWLAAAAPRRAEAAS